MTARRGLFGAVAAVLVLWLGVGWYYAGQALTPGGARETDLDRLVIGGVDDGRVSVNVGSDDLAVQNASLAVTGLLYAGGYGLLSGDAVAGPCPGAAQEATCVTRDFHLVTGAAPQHATAARVDEYAVVPGAPDVVLGDALEVLDVKVPGGIAPAWWVPPASSDVVAVLVHGRGGSPDEMLRIAPILQGLGLGVLVPTYRGDGIAPEPEDGIGRFGEQEWLDVALAMMHDAVPSDARFVLVGYSQGAGVVASLLENGDLAERVDAVILDSPLIGLDATMRLQARIAGIPNVLVRPVLESAYLVARLQGFDFSTGEHVDFLAEQPRPILLFHGPGDTFVPVGPSERLAALDREGVTYVRVDGVDHVRFWNHDPSGYAEAVTSFLAAHLPTA